MQGAIGDLGSSIDGQFARAPYSRPPPSLSLTLFFTMLALFARPSRAVRALAAQPRLPAAAAAFGERSVSVARRSFAKRKSKREAVPVEKEEALRMALKHVQSTFGAGAVMQLGAKNADREAVDVVSTGSLALDLALGVGGLPRGRVVEIYGPESSGKTTLALHAIAEVQKAGGKCLFIDAEHALDQTYAAALGVDTDALYVAQPDTGEQGLEIADTFARSGGVDVIVVDSVAALVPRAELEGEMGDVHMGLQARLMSQALRKITGTLGKTNCLLIFINQLRMKIGVMFGNPEVTAGGHALRYYSSMRLEVRRTGVIKDGDRQVGTNVRVKVSKNKLAPPFREVHLDIIFGKGFHKTAEMVDLAVHFGIFQKSGAWYKRGEEQLGQGRAGVIQRLERDPAMAAEVEQLIRDAAAAELTAVLVHVVHVPRSGRRRRADGQRRGDPRH